MLRSGRKGFHFLEVAAQVVETSVTVNNNSPIRDYVHPVDQTQPTFGFIFNDAKPPPKAFAANLV